MSNEHEKELAGRAAAQLVHDGDVVGLGTGSTAYFAVLALGERVKAGMKIVGIPTSNATAELAKKVGIALTTFDDHPSIDITIDGADELDPHLNLIKGGGGALLREKVVAAASKKVVIVADSAKTVPVLGKFPLPIEIVAFARAVVENKIKSLGATVKLRTKPDVAGKPGGAIYLTDNGNPILDCHFGQIPDPAPLARTLSDTPGIVEHGLFIGLAGEALIGTKDGVETMTSNPR